MINEKRLWEYMKQMKSNDFSELLPIAASKADTEIILYLLNCGIHPDTQDSLGWTALMWSSQNGSIQLAKLLIQKGANVNIKNKAGNTALIRAVKSEAIQIILLLIKNNADVTVKNNNNETALNSIIDTRIKKLLIKKGATE